MENSLELLEEKFRKVEQASERKALDERDLSRTELVDPLTEPRKHHKKSMVSVSQFGKQEAQQGEDGLRSLAPSPLSAAASKSTFYHALAHPRSVDSLVSGYSGEGTHHTDEQHEIQVQRIAGRQTLPQTVGALLPRRLARAKSHIEVSSALKREVVIDVSVETTIASSHLPPIVSTVYATRPSRSHAVTSDVVTPQGGLVGRAKDLASKLRRKGRTDIL